MKPKPRVLAITRWSKTICPRCVSDAEEVTIMQDPDSNIRLMAESGIGVLRPADLRGGEKCAMCGTKIIDEVTPA